MFEMVLYSTGCPKCKILERKLEDKQLKYEVVSDIDTMGRLGIQSVPMLRVDGSLMDFGEAVRWVNQQ